jgi:hypothetical protein
LIIFGIPFRFAFRVGRPLELVSGDEPLDGPAVKVKDGGCLPAVPAGLIEDQLQVSPLQLFHARPVRDQSLFGTSRTVRPQDGLRNFRWKAICCDKAVR